MFKHWDASRLSRVLSVSGYLAIGLSVVALVLGLVLVETTVTDLRATVNVSGDAMTAILDTVDLVDQTTAELKEGVDAAAEGIGGVSNTATVGAASIEDVAVFLDTSLPEDLEAISGALPAAIQAAGAIDGTLRALSFIGVDYAPAEPFNESLRKVQSALSDLPDDLRNQAESLRNLVPAAADLAAESDRLSLALIRLGEDLDGITEIVDAYNETLQNARATVVQAEATLDRNVWIFRLTLIALATVGVAVGFGLLATEGFVDSLVAVEMEPDL